MQKLVQDFIALDAELIGEDMIRLVIQSTAQGRAEFLFPSEFLKETVIKLDRLIEKQSKERILH